jgi:hypothetical protein
MTTITLDLSTLTLTHQVTLLTAASLARYGPADAVLSTRHTVGHGHTIARPIHPGVWAAQEYNRDYMPDYDRMKVTRHGIRVWLGDQELHLRYDRHLSTWVAQAWDAHEGLIMQRTDTRDLTASEAATLMVPPEWRS